VRRPLPLIPKVTRLNRNLDNFGFIVVFLDALTKVLGNVFETSGYLLFSNNSSFSLSLEGRHQFFHRQILNIQRASDPTPTSIEHMGVDHGGLHIFMTQQLLNCADVIAVFQQVGRETMTKRMASDSFLDTSLSHGSL
jgi:hypothetical protein